MKMDYRRTRNMEDQSINMDDQFASEEENVKYLYDDHTDNSCGCCARKLSITAKLYIANAITTWGDRMWSFAVSLFLVKMSQDFDLQLTAIYGLMCSLFVIIFGAPVGRWIDKAPRLSAAVKIIVTQNAFVIICAAIIMFTLVDDQRYVRQHQWIFLGVKIMVILSGALAYLASMGSSICISKDWIVVICQGDNERLAKINATCRCIDLTTKISSPFLVGLVMSQMSDFVAATCIASWNILSMIMECLLIRSIYNMEPALSKTKIDSQDRNRLIMEESAKSNSDPIPRPTVSPTSSSSCFGETSAQIIEYVQLWTAYFRHAIFPAGFGLACLYMTVLGFDGITIGYASSQGVSEYVLGLLAGAGAIVGIVGTIFYPILRKKIGTERTGLIGFFSEVSCLVACVVSIWAPGSPFQQTEYVSPGNDTNSGDTSNNTLGQPHSINASVNSNREYTSVILLMTGIVCARFGLWLVDLTVTQIIQEGVEEEQRGAINGTQYSLNMFMDLLKYTLVILFPSPKTFGFLIMASFAVICLGWGSYAIYSWRQRRHILPFHQYFKNCTSIKVPGLQPKDDANKHDSNITQKQTDEVE